MQVNLPEWDDEGSSDEGRGPSPISPASLTPEEAPEAPLHDHLVDVPCRPQPHTLTVTLSPGLTTVRADEGEADDRPGIGSQAAPRRERATPPDESDAPFPRFVSSVSASRAAEEDGAASQQDAVLATLDSLMLAAVGPSSQPQDLAAAPPHTVMLDLSAALSARAAERPDPPSPTLPSLPSQELVQWTQNMQGPVHTPGGGVTQALQRLRRRPSHRSRLHSPGSVHSRLSTKSQLSTASSVSHHAKAWNAGVRGGATAAISGGGGATARLAPTHPPSVPLVNGRLAWRRKAKSSGYGQKPAASHARASRAAASNLGPPNAPPQDSSSAAPRQDPLPRRRLLDSLLQHLRRSGCVSMADARRSALLLVSDAAALHAAEAAVVRGVQPARVASVLAAGLSGDSTTAASQHSYISHLPDAEVRARLQRLMHGTSQPADQEVDGSSELSSTASSSASVPQQQPSKDLTLEPGAMVDLDDASDDASSADASQQPTPAFMDTPRSAPVFGRASSAEGGVRGRGQGRRPPRVPARQVSTDTHYSALSAVAAAASVSGGLPGGRTRRTASTGAGSVTSLTAAPLRSSGSRPQQASSDISSASARRAQGSSLSTPRDPPESVRTPTSNAQEADLDSSSTQTSPSRATGKASSPQAAAEVLHEVPEDFPPSPATSVHGEAQSSPPTPLDEPPAPSGGTEAPPSKPSVAEEAPSRGCCAWWPWKRQGSATSA